MPTQRFLAALQGTLLVSSEVCGTTGAGEHMMMSRIAVSMLVTGLAITGAQTVLAQATSAAGKQSFPTKPIRIVTGGIGSGTDLPSRFVAQGLTAALGQQVIVDNRGSGLIPGEIV